MYQTVSFVSLNGPTSVSAWMHTENPIGAQNKGWRCECPCTCVYVWGCLCRRFARSAKVSEKERKYWYPISRLTLLNMYEQVPSEMGRGGCLRSR